MQIAADRKAGGLPPPSKGGAAGHRESATPLMFSAPLRVLRGQKAVLRAPPCLSVDQLVLFITTFKREESSDEKIDTTVIPEICDKHRAKTTNCRICQHFTGPHAEKARREATQGQAHTTGRTRAVLSAIPGMRVPKLLPLPWHLAYPLHFLPGKKAGQTGVSDHFSFRCLHLRIPQIRSRTTKTKSTINPMSAATNRPPPKQNGYKYTSMIFAKYQ